MLPFDSGIHIAARDNERRRIGYASLQAKISYCISILNAADKIISESVAEFGNDEELMTPESYAKRYCQHEAAYACIEEAMTLLSTSQTLCVRLSGPVSLLPLERFAKSIESNNQ